MSTEISCLCGEVELSLEGEPVGQFYCHCDDCQAANGAPYIGIALYPNESVRIIEGDPVTWTYKRNPRSRCQTCGTMLFADPPGVPFKGIKAHLLPENTFKPTAHLQCRYAVLPLADDLPHYKGFPPEFGGSDETVDW